MTKNYDVIIIGAGPGGIYAAYELNKLAPELKVAVIEAGGKPGIRDFTDVIVILIVVIINSILSGEF